MKALAKFPETAVAGHVVYRKKHWWSRKQKFIIIVTTTGMYEMEWS